MKIERLGRALFSAALIAAAIASLALAPLGSALASGGGGSQSWISKRFKKSSKPKAKRVRRAPRVKRAARRKPARRTTRRKTVRRASNSRSNTRRRASNISTASVSPPSQSVITQANAVANAAATNADNGIDICSEGLSDAPLFGCIAKQLEKLAETLEKNKAAKKVMPKTIEAVKKTAKKLRSAKTQNEAVVAIQEAKVEIDKAIAQAAKGVTKEYGGVSGMQAVSASLGKGISAIQKKTS